MVSCHKLLPPTLLLLLLCLCLRTNAKTPTLTHFNETITLQNGYLTVKLSVKGHIVSISYGGVRNILSDTPPFPDKPWRRGFGWKEDDRGYYDSVGNYSSTGYRIYERFVFTSWKVHSQTADLISVVFQRPFNSSDTSQAVPADISVFFAIDSKLAALYTWAYFLHKKSMPSSTFRDFRMVFKLRPSLFDTTVIADGRQRHMPDWFDLRPDRSNMTMIPEARNLTNPHNPAFKYEIDHKYHYLLAMKDQGVYGWISNSSDRIGVWAVNPRKVEYSPGGPFKQCLSVQTGAILLNSLQSSHLGTSSLNLQRGRAWKKVYGPWLLYLNKESQTTGGLWSDAKKRAAEEELKWPYKWVSSTVDEEHRYPSLKNRAKVRGHFSVLGEEGARANLSKAWIGLAPLGGLSSWSLNAEGYQFWTRVQSNGTFLIPDVRKGSYNLFATVPGIFGEFSLPAVVRVTNSSLIDLGKMAFRPPRLGRTLWEIGYPNRDSSDFFVPVLNPLSRFPYPSQGPNRFRNYGAWTTYSKDTEEDLTFIANISEPAKNWWYVQPTRLHSNGSLTGTTWRIMFSLGVRPRVNDTYYLRIGVASSHFAVLQVHVNYPQRRMLFNSILCNCTIGNRDNAMARGSSYGIYNMYNIPVRGGTLLRGVNAIYLMQRQNISPYVYLMYDYIRFEGPAT